MRTARSRTSGENLFDLVIAPSSQVLEPPQKPGRFSRSLQPTGEHEFDQLCQSLGIEHRLTKPKKPQTNGMVERFNGRLSQVLRSHHFNSAEDLGKTLHRFVWLYNHHLPQKALGHQAPVQAIKVWKMKAPDLFVKNVRNHPGPDS